MNFQEPHTMTQHDDILALVIDKIRTTINEDWILDYEIGMDPPCRSRNPESSLR